MSVKSLILTSSLLTAGLAGASAQAETVDVTITNLTHGSYFTPILSVAHQPENHLFHTGGMASDALQAMAEGGSLDGLISDAQAAASPYFANPADGLLEPGKSTSFMDFDTGDHGYLSLVSMILPSNDGFIGIDSWKVPSEPGTYTILVNAYDAGTEANDEIVNGGGAPGAAGIPVNPGANGGTNGSGVTSEETNSYIHIHRGVLGDTDPNGGASDLDSRIHRWLNPVARVTVVVK